MNNTFLLFHFPTFEFVIPHCVTRRVSIKGISGKAISSRDQSNFIILLKISASKTFLPKIV